MASSTAVRRAVPSFGDAISIATHSAGPLLQAHRLGDIARAGKAPGRSTSRVFWGRRAMTERLALASGRGRSLPAPAHFPTSPRPATPAGFFHIVGNILIRHAIRGGKFQCELHSPCVTRNKLAKMAHEAQQIQSLATRPTSRFGATPAKQHQTPGSARAMAIASNLLKLHHFPKAQRAA